MSSAWCLQAQHRRAPGDARRGIAPVRRGRISKHVQHHNVAGCDAAGLLVVPHCAVSSAGSLEAQSLSDETSQTSRRWLQRIAWLGRVGIAVVAVYVACGMQGSSGMLASVAGTLSSTSNSAAEPVQTQRICKLNASTRSSMRHH